MQRRARLIFLGLALLVLLVVGLLVTGSVSFIAQDFWFTSGLLLVILLSTVEQPYFTSESNAFMNAIAGGLSLLLIAPRDRIFLWYVFLIWCLYLMVSSYAVMLIRSRELASEHPAVSFVSRLNREIGRPEALFSAFFLWGVFEQYSPESSAYKALLLYWAIFIILNLTNVSGHIATAVTRRSASDAGQRGVVRSFLSPRLFECELTHDTPSLAPGTEATIRLPDHSTAASGQVIDDRILKGTRIARIAVTAFGTSWNRLADPRVTSPPHVFISTDAPPQDRSTAPVGVVGEGSTIGALRLTVNPTTDLVDGEVLAIDLPKQRAYFQVVAASLKANPLGDRQRALEVQVEASQLGIWRDEKCRFDPIPWVAPAGALVMRLLQQDSVSWSVPEGHLELGKVPNSAFPVHLSLPDLVTHNTAIIGVTGSGKSYLAFWMIEGLIRSGIRVLVLDVSRQHYVFLKDHNPYQIKEPDDTATWLNGDDKLAIHQYATSGNYPLTTSRIIANTLEWLEGQVKLKAGENEPAHLCIVIEEAHSLIPEWNQVAQRGDESHVNRTARTILQGRKYGMGCVIISQRTANVTKTILNQCNTIVALQSFDQTGLDFLSNYMGESYAHAISTLPSQHAVLVGKASSSTRPILFQIRDLGSAWGSDHPPEGEAGGGTEATDAPPA